MAPPLPISPSAVDRLSKRLRTGPQVSDEDLDLFLEVLQAYQQALEVVQARLRVLRYEPTSRLKTTSVLIEKLQREHTSLKSVQDIAGARIVVDGGRDVQDDVVAAVVEAFDDGSKPPRVRDRRAEPSHGYRAVHVVAMVLGLPVEIQIRTVAQDQWAQMVESLGDKWGRGIRYGEPPPDPDRVELGDVTRAALWDLVQGLAERIGTVETMAGRLARLEVAVEKIQVERERIRQLGALPQDKEDQLNASLQDLNVLKADHTTAEETLKHALDVISQATAALPS